MSRLWRWLFGARLAEPRQSSPARHLDDDGLENYLDYQEAPRVPPAVLDAEKPRS